MAMANLAKLLLLAGLMTALAGALLWAASRWHLPFGHLPGDIVYKRKNLTIYFPWVSMLLISLILSLLLRWFIKR